MSIGGLIRKGTSYKSERFPDQNGIVYVHWDRNNFYKNVGKSNVQNLEGLAQSDISKAYDRHRQRASQRMATMENFDYDNYVDVTTKAVEVLDNLLDSSASKNIATKLQEMIVKRGEIGLSSKWSLDKKTGQYSAQLRELIKNIGEVQRVYDGMKVLHEEYKKIDNEVVRVARSRGKSIASDFPRNELYILKDVPQAKTSYDNLTNSLDALESIINSVNTSGATGISPTTQAGKDTMEIMRKFTGMLNNIQGIGYEAIIEALLTEETIEKKVAQELAKGLGVGSGDVQIIFEDNLGTGATTETASRATTDVAFTIKINSQNMTGSFDMNLSAKSIAKVTKNKLRKGTVSYKSGRPWGRIADELGLVDTEFEYWFANLSVKNTARSFHGGRTATGKGAYEAIRNYVGAMYALDAIAGTGEGIQGQTRQGRDIVTHMIYLNKVMSVVDVLNDLEKRGGLNVTIGPAVNQGKEDFIQDKEGTVYERYIRSKNVLSAIRGIPFRFSKS